MLLRKTRPAACAFLATARRLEVTQNESSLTFQIACPILRAGPPLQPRNRCGRFVKSSPEADLDIAGEDPALSKIRPWVSQVISAGPNT